MLFFFLLFVLFLFAEAHQMGGVVPGGVLGALLFLSNVVRLIRWGPDDKDPTAHIFQSIFLFPSSSTYLPRTSLIIFRGPRFQRVDWFPFNEFLSKPIRGIARYSKPWDCWIIEWVNAILPVQWISSKNLD